MSLNFCYSSSKLSTVYPAVECPTCTLGVIKIQEAEYESSWQEGSYARYHAPPLLSTDRSLAHRSHLTK